MHLSCPLNERKSIRLATILILDWYSSFISSHFFICNNQVIDITRYRGILAQIIWNGCVCYCVVLEAHSDWDAYTFQLIQIHKTCTQVIRGIYRLRCFDQFYTHHILKFLQVGITRNICLDVVFYPLFTFNMLEWWYDFCVWFFIRIRFLY